MKQFRPRLSLKENIFLKEFRRKKTNRLVILEESWPFGNISTEITYQVQNQIFDYLDAPIEKINTADTPAPYSPVLLAEWIPNSSDVIKSVKKVLYKS